MKAIYALYKYNISIRINFYCTIFETNEVVVNYRNKNVINETERWEMQNHCRKSKVLLLLRLFYFYDNGASEVYELSQ